MQGGPAERLRARIAAQGPLSWSVVIDEALYGPAGFYALGGGAGRSRDFLTSPELGPLFGAVVARAIDREWIDRGRPESWTVVEAGAGAGTLAAAVLDAGPTCGPALNYVAVEVSEPLRQVATASLGSRANVVGRFPDRPFTGMVIANELLDNLPFDVYRRTADGWEEIRVAGNELAEVGVPATPDVVAELARLAPGAAVGRRVPCQVGARAWLRNALDVVSLGRVVVIDYACTTDELATRDWLRTYRRGGPGGPPLEALGSQDITVDVAVDQLALVEAPSGVRSQATWLDNHGLADLERAAAAAWRVRAAIGNLEALKARSRVGEAVALRDPSGLGDFTVIEWSKDPPTQGAPADW